MQTDITAFLDWLREHENQRHFRLVDIPEPLRESYLEYMEGYSLIVIGGHPCASRQSIYSWVAKAFPEAWKAFVNSPGPKIAPDE